MFYRLTCFLYLLTFAHIGWAAEDNTTFKFARKHQSKALLGQTDNYTNQFGKFDLQSKTQKLDGTLDDYLSFAKKQVVKWEKDEVNLLEGILANFISRIEALNLNLSLPDEVIFLKTTLNEESSAEGYTRANYIVINENALNEENENLEYLVYHELFHVLSRFDDELRKKLYKIIGFECCQTIAIPDIIRDRYITNPDAPLHDAYIKLKQEGRVFDALMLIYATKEYAGGSFFDYLNIGFIELAGAQNKKQVVLEDGEPKIYRLDEVEGFFEQIGRNTQYIIDPEEIMADNFSFLILGKEELKNPEILEGIKETLQK